MSKITVTTIAGQTSGSDANTVKIESGDTLAVQTNATVGGTLGVTGATTLTGDLAVDTNVLKVDTSNNRVGIGATSPYKPLTIMAAIGGTKSDLLDLQSSNAGGGTQPMIRFGTEASNSNTIGRCGFVDIPNYGGGFVVETNSTGGATHTTTEKFRIDKDGIVTKPLQPAFLARFNGASVNINNEVWVFNATNINGGFNVGGHYSTSTGKFTAPVDGRYFFHFSSIINTQGTNLTIQLRVNNNVTDQIHISQDENGWNTYGVSNIYNLSASDYVTVFVVGNYNLYGQTWSRFTGHLIG